jgi:hypothetical protein
VTTNSPSAGSRTWQGWTLAAVELFVAYQAVSGGIGLITGTWPMPTEWLSRTPFTTWVGPGWVLIGLVALPQVLAAVPVVFLPRKPLLGILGGTLAGASLLLWIIAQLGLLQLFFFLQPIVAGLGLVEIALAQWWRTRLARLREYRNQQTHARVVGDER